MQIEMKVALDFAWGIRAKLRAEGDKLWAEGARLWAEAILAFAENIKREWIWRSDKNAAACRLESGEIFEP